MERLAKGASQLNCVVKSIKSINQAYKFKGEEAKQMRSLLHQMAEEPEHLAFASMVRLLCIMAFSKQIQQVGSPSVVGTLPSEKVRQIESFVACNLDKRITLADAATHLGMNEAAFCVFFKRKFGESFFTHLRKKRIEKACHLLVDEPQKTVVEISYECGFTNASYFNNVFKKLMHCTPLDYRANETVTDWE